LPFELLELQAVFAEFHRVHLGLEGSPEEEKTNKNPEKIVGLQPELMKLHTCLPLKILKL
jgi:hypothetical protein